MDKQGLGFNMSKLKEPSASRLNVNKPIHVMNKIKNPTQCTATMHDWVMVVYEGSRAYRCSKCTWVLKLK